MADQANDQGGVFGSTADLNAGSALEAVQAEEIRRLNQEKAQAEAFTPSSKWQVVPEGIAVPPGGEFRMDLNGGQNSARWPQMTPATAVDVPVTAAQMMQEAAQEAQARTDAANIRAAGFESDADAPPMPQPVPTRRSGFDAAAANARAANRHAGFSVPQSTEGKVTSSAPATAGSVFDAFAYDEAVHAQQLQVSGETPPVGGWDALASDPSVAPSPSYSAPVEEADLWAERKSKGRVDAGMVSASPELHSQLDSLRASVAPGPSNPRPSLSAAYNAVREALAPSAETEEAPHRTYASYEEAQQAKQDILTDAKNVYTARGDYNLIDKAGFKADVKAEEISQGLREPAARGFRGALANMREDFAEPYGKLNYGYALAQMGQEGGQFYEKTNSGQYVTPEQRETAGAGFLPGAGALLGTAIGSMIAPGVGSWVGGLAGGGAGALAQGIVGANEAKEQATREAAERLAASLNSTADSIGAFKSQLEATGAPIASLAQGLSSLQGTGPGVGSAAIAGAGRVALAEGEFYGANTAETARFLGSSPALAPLAQAYRTDQSTMTRGQYQSVAQLALAEGDTGEFNTAMLQASTATLTNDPQYQGAARRLEADKNNPIFQARHWWDTSWMNTGPLGDGSTDGDYIGGAQKQMDERKKALGIQDAADAKKYVDEFADINRGRQGLIDAGLNVKIGQTGLATAVAGGAGSAEMRRLMPGINASLDAATAADQTIITTDTALMNGLTAASDPTGSIRASYQTLINQAKSDQVQNPLAKVQNARSVFETSLQEDESAYGLSLTTQQSGLTRGLLSGRRYDQLAGDENGIVSTENARAAQLRRSAENPLNDPAKRDAMLAQAAAMETQAGVQQHDFQQNVYRQALVQDDQRVAGAGLQVEQARSFGTEASIYGAQGQEADALRAKMAELTSELTRGGNTADETAEKMRQITQAGGQLNAVLAQQRDERLAAQQSVATSQFQQDTAGLSRQVQIAGSGAVNFDTLNADFQKTFRADQSAIDAFKPGDPRRNAAEAKLAADRAESREYEGGLTRYTPTAQTSIQGLTAQDETERARHAFQREMLLPYRSGDPDSNPLTRGLGLEKALDKSAAYIDTQEQAAKTYRSQQQNKVGADGKPLWDNLAEENYQQQLVGFHEQKDSLLDQRAQLEHDRIWEMDKRLPEMIAGGGGLTSNSVLAIPQAALSAFFHPNVRDGSWGHPVTQPGLSRPGSLPGNAYDGFQQHAGQQGAAPAGTATSAAAALQQIAHGMNTQQLAVLLTQIVQSNQELVRLVGSGQKLPGQDGPPQSSHGALRSSVSNSIDTNRPSRR